jgi:hypothetical protein
MQDDANAQRDIFLTPRVEARSVSDIMGKAHVNAPSGTDGIALRCNARLSSSGHLKPLRSSDLPCCRVCSTLPAATLTSRKVHLPTIDLYAGGGGSVLGMGKHFNVRWAVEN